MRNNVGYFLLVTAEDDVKQPKIVFGFVSFALPSDEQSTATAENKNTVGCQYSQLQGTQGQLKN